MKVRYSYADYNYLIEYSKEHAIIYNSKKSSVLIICKNRATMHVHLLSMIRSSVR